MRTFVENKTAITYGSCHKSLTKLWSLLRFNGQLGSDSYAILEVPLLPERASRAIPS